MNLDCALQQPMSIIPATFFFMRHGETEGNVRNLCQGQIEFPLTTTGKEQARHAANILSAQNISTIFTSPLSRAHDSAKIIASTLNIQDIRIHNGLVERGWGVQEGKCNRKMFEQEELERQGQSLALSEIDGIEDKNSFLRRIEHAMNEVLIHGQNLAIVSHGRFFNALCELMNVKPIQQIPNGAPIFCQHNKNTGWNIDVMGS